MDHLEDALRISHDWALTRIRALSEPCDVHCVNNACAIHEEFREWLNEGVRLDDVLKLVTIKK